MHGKKQRGNNLRIIEIIYIELTSRMDLENESISDGFGRIYQWFWNV